MNQFKTNGMIIRKTNFLNFCEKLDAENPWLGRINDGADYYLLYLAKRIFGDCDVRLSQNAWAQDGRFVEYQGNGIIFAWDKDEAEICKKWREEAK